MGKQWSLYNKLPADATYYSTEKSSSTGKNTTGKSRKRGAGHSSSSSFGGCMSAIFHLFDNIHHLPFHQPSFISDSSIIKIPEEPNSIIKGVEAPRNSLEIEEEEPVTEQIGSSSSSFKLQQETNFNITPMREIQINTKRSRLMEDISSECSSSPGTKTPTLVARLMGLDLLPESSSPRPSLSSPRNSSSSSSLNPLSKLSSNKYNAGRSLPATPRTSTAPRPSTEVIDYHHRFSLQINKENKRRYDENTTSEYAKQIAKQVRENISRRVGTDITNTTVKKKEYRRDEFLVLLKPNRSSPPCTAASIHKSKKLDEGKENYESTSLSCSARIRLWEIKNNLNQSNSSPLKSSPLSSTSSEATKLAPVPLMKQEVQVVKPLKIQKCNKRIASEKYELRLKKLPQQEDQQFLKKCNKKSTPLVKVNTTTKFISSKKLDIIPSPSSTTLPQKQVPLASITQLPSCQSWSYNTKKTHKLSLQDQLTTNGNVVAGAGAGAGATTGSSVSDYISTILSHSGIEETTLISISHWYSPSHPLHPSIFHQIEKHLHPTATGSAGRKLIFEVVDELLVGILKPYISLKPWALCPRNSHRMFGSELIGILSEKISCFPAADCKVLEDIDGLIEGDMRNSTRVVGEIAFEEEAEELVTEMERDMVDTLVGELAGMILHLHVGVSV